MERIKLKARIIDRFGSLGNFAKACGTNYQTVWNTVSGNITPKGMALVGWRAALEIPENETYIFFGKCVENNTTEEA